MAAIIVSFLFQQSELRTFLVIAALLAIFIYYKYDGRILMGYGVLLLVGAGILTFTKEEDYAKLTAILSYWLLVAGTSCLLVEFYRKNLNHNISLTGKRNAESTI